MTRAIQALGRRVAALLSAYDVSRDRLDGHIKKRKGRIKFMDFCRYVRLLYPAEVRLHFVLDNFPRTRASRAATGAYDNNVELVYRLPCTGGRARLGVVHRQDVRRFQPPLSGCGHTN